MLPMGDDFNLMGSDPNEYEEEKMGNNEYVEEEEYQHQGDDGQALHSTGLSLSDPNAELPDGFAPVPSLPMVYKWMVSSIGESMAQAMPMSVRVSIPLDSIRSIAQGISLHNPGQADEMWKHMWITAHTRHFHGVIVLAWARMQQSESCNPDCCPKMIVGKTEVRWKQSPEELAAYEDGDPYKVTYLSLPAAEYIDRALAENHGILSESSITPFVGGLAQPGVSDYEFSFSSYFIPTMKEVYKYILRVYTHLYLYHVDLLPSTFASFLGPPLPAGAVPTAQKELEKFSFHLAYFLHFGLSFHLITHEQVDSLGHAMKYFIWNLPDMEDQVPVAFKQLVAANPHLHDQHQMVNYTQSASVRSHSGSNSPPEDQPASSPGFFSTLAAAFSSSSNPFLQSSTSGPQPSNQSSEATPSMGPAGMMPNGMMPNGMLSMMPGGMIMGMDLNGQPMMMPYPPPIIQAVPPPNDHEEEIKKLKEEVEKLRLATLAKPATPAPAPAPIQPVSFASPFASSPFASPFSPLPPQTPASPNTGFSLAAAKAVSNIDPQLIALKRAELIKKAIAPFIAHNLAIAKVEQDLRESNFPPNYVPSPGYGPNGFLLPKEKPSTSPISSHQSLNRPQTQSSSSSPHFGGEDYSPKVLAPSTRERNKYLGGDDGEERSVSRNGIKSKSKSKKEPSVSASSKRSLSSRSNGDESDSSDTESETNSPHSKSLSSQSHSRPDAQLLGAPATNSPSSLLDEKTVEENPPVNNSTLAGKKPIPRRPIPNRPPPQGREPSCGQRLCF